MKKVVLTLLIFIIFSCVSKKDYTALQSEIEMLDQELKAFRQENEDLLAQLDYETSKSKELANSFIFQDSDGDGVSDEYDQCPDLAGNVTNSGCPGLSESQASVEVVEKEKIIYQDVIITKIDTLVKSSSRITNGNIAFYCPTEMYKGEPYDAYGLIADVMSEDKIKSMVINEIKKHDADVTTEATKDENFYIEQLSYYDMIKLELTNVGGQTFTITNIHSSDKRSYKSKNKDWHWKVTPTVSGQNQQLVLKITLYNKEGEEIYADSKTYEFDINVRANQFFYNTKELFIENPEWAWGSIIIPFITFIFGKYQERRKSKKAEA